MRSTMPGFPARCRLVQMASVGIPAALIAVSGCGGSNAAPGSPPDPPRLIVLFYTCTLNADYLQPYNPDIAYTPNLKRLARDAIVFERHQTESGQSGISFSSLFTGAQAGKHGVYMHPAPIAENVAVLPEMLRDAGYDPHYWLRHPMAKAAIGDAARRESGSRPVEGWLRSEDARFRALLSRLRDEPEYRAVVTAAYSVTHGPYKTDRLEEFLERYPGAVAHPAGMELDEYLQLAHLFFENHLELSFDYANAVAALGLSEEQCERLAVAQEALYASRVQYLDELVGQLMAELANYGLRDETLVVFTADHGEVLYRDNALYKWNHGHALAPEVLRVPLIVRPHAPGRYAAGRYVNVTRSIDLLPTVLGMAGVDLSPYGEVEGVDLSPVLRKEAPPRELLAFSHTALISKPLLEASQNFELFHTYYPAQDPNLIWVGVRDKDLVVKWRPDGAGNMIYEAFDLARDPEERMNVFSEDEQAHVLLARRLREYKEYLVRRYYELHPDAETSFTIEEQEERLRSLGYIE